MAASSGYRRHGAGLSCRTAPRFTGHVPVNRGWQRSENGKPARLRSTRYMVQPPRAGQIADRTRIALWNHP